MADGEYFINKIENNQGSNIFNLLEYRQKDVGKEGNCGYRVIALQLYSNKNYHNLIRKDVYDYLTLNKDNFVGFNFEYAGNLLDANEYIEKVKKTELHEKRIIKHKIENNNNEIQMQNDNETKIQKDNNNLLKPIKVNSLEIIDIKKIRYTWKEIIQKIQIIKKNKAF